MTLNQKFSANNQEDESVDDELIDLQAFFSTLVRNSKLIAIFSLFGVLLMGIIGFSTRRTWKGEFQIVLEDSNNNPSSVETSLARYYPGFSREMGSNLKTQVGILSSQSVLINIFDFVKKEKQLKYSNIKNLSFKSWQKSLNINLSKGTSILKLSYKDKDKGLVLPVLNRISKTYQEYSGRKRLRNIELGKKYFNEQIMIFKNKSLDSAKNVQEFAIKHDLSILPVGYKPDSGYETDIDIENPNILNVESIRLTAAIQIREIDQQLLQIDNLKDDYSQIISEASLIPALDQLSVRLQEVENKLAQSRLYFRENDKRVMNFLRERNYLIDLLKNQIRGNLLVQKTKAQARLKAAERPAGILIEYKMLISKAAKDQFTLNNLENQYRSLLLEEARLQDPWELITTPTLLPDPVAPKRKRMLLLGFVGGTFLGVGASFISERRQNITRDSSQPDL